MARLNPRITPHPNGTCTVSGIPYRDLCSILTSCTLHRYEEEERNPLTDPYSLLWHKRILTICKYASPPSRAHTGAHGPPAHK